MDKRIVLLMILFFVLIYTSVSPLRSKVAKASGTIYIMADGSVDPPTAPIQCTDNTYTLTNDIYEPIVVKKDYIIIDGAGFTVQGAGNGKGIDISGRNYVTIKNTNIKTFSTGVYLYQLSSYNSITGNNITNCSLASLLDRSIDPSIKIYCLLVASTTISGNGMRYMICTNGKCEYNPSLNRGKVKRTHDQTRYAQLWAEIELPKLLRGEKQ